VYRYDGVELSAEYQLRSELGAALFGDEQDQNSEPASHKIGYVSPLVSGCTRARSPAALSPEADCAWPAIALRSQFLYQVFTQQFLGAARV
jgi:hypothetical protein